VQAIRDGKLELLYEGETRSIDQTRLVGIVFAAHPFERKASGPYQRFQFVDGQRVSGLWTAIVDDHYEVETAWGSRCKLPAAEIGEISGHNGRMVNLSDIEPAVVEQVPYFGRIRPYQKDKSLSGEALQIGDETFKKGLAAHARTVLSFELGGEFASFRTTIGFEPSAGRQGRVACRVLGDGRELFVDADLRADEPPTKLDLPVSGVSMLVLEVDFGEDEDSGDDVVWGNPRLYRDSAESPPPPASGS
jgi:hypothetical protein